MDLCTLSYIILNPNFEFESNPSPWEVDNSTFQQLDRDVQRLVEVGCLDDAELLELFVQCCPQMDIIRFENGYDDELPEVAEGFHADGYPLEIEESAATILDFLPFF